MSQKRTWRLVVSVGCMVGLFGLVEIVMARNVANTCSGHLVKRLPAAAPARPQVVDFVCIGACNGDVGKCQHEVNIGTTQLPPTSGPFGGPGHPVPGLSNFQCSCSASEHSGVCDATAVRSGDGRLLTARCEGECPGAQLCLEDPEFTFADPVLPRRTQARFKCSCK